MTEIILFTTSIFSDHKYVKTEITRKNCKNRKHKEEKQCTTNYQWVTEVIKVEIKKYGRQMKMETQSSNIYVIKQ